MHDRTAIFQPLQCDGPRVPLRARAPRRLGFSILDLGRRYRWSISRPTYQINTYIGLPRRAHEARGRASARRQRKVAASHQELQPVLRTVAENLDALARAADSFGDDRI